MDDQLLRDLEILTQLLEEGGWRELQVIGPQVRVLISRDRDTGMERKAAPAAQLAVPTSPTVAPVAGQEAVRVAAIDPSWSAVTAPNLGTFYRAPKPGAPVFVEVGQKVSKGAELCLIEVMKLFTSVRSEFVGTVRHIAVGDGELVEGGQALIYIESD